MSLRTERAFKTGAPATAGNDRAFPARPTSSDRTMTDALPPFDPGDRRGPEAATEGVDPRFRRLEDMAPEAVLAALLHSQAGAADAVRRALGFLEEAVAAAARRLALPDSRLVYAGAGTSGRLAVLDGVELGPTFSWPPERTVFLLAGGDLSFAQAQEGAEDDEAAARAAVAAAMVGPGDVLVAVAASGRTPFTLAALRSANEAGALTIAIANDARAPLLEAARHAVLLDTGAEVLAGSTRLAAGTAQKIALNLFSTALMIALGRVFRGRMTSMQVSNAKLRRRAVSMVADLAGCDEGAAEDALAATGQDIRAAVLRVEAAR